MSEPTRPGDRILRHEIPVDDQWHTLPLTGPIVHVAARRLDAVEAWALDHHHTPPVQRTLRVYGTGQPLDPNLIHLGTAITPGGGLVWHLMERPPRTVYHPDQWRHILAAGLLPAIQQWLRDNEIDPSDIPTHTPISIRDRDGKPVIAYSAYLHDADGHKYIDPEKGDEAATEQRTTLCLAEPPQALLDLSADL